MLCLALVSFGAVAKWLGTGLQNRHMWVQIPSAPLDWLKTPRSAAWGDRFRRPLSEPSRTIRTRCSSVNLLVFIGWTTSPSRMATPKPGRPHSGFADTVLAVGRIARTVTVGAALHAQVTVAQRVRPADHAPTKR